jgi:hypothetical protein
MARTESFYGTDIETYYVDAKGRAWLIQSPEMGSDVVAVSADCAVGDELAHSALDAEFFELAAKLDRVPRGEGGALTSRYLESQGEATMGKDDVWRWETVATYVLTFADGDREGACDVEVQIGEVSGSWFVRTRDDAGGSDECSGKAYETEAAATEAAEAFADEHDESDGAASAEDYLTNQLEAEAEEGRDDDGEWCVYWYTALDDEGPRERYSSRAAAEAAAELANKRLHAANPGRLLCGYGVRRLVDGKWVSAEEVGS